MISKLWPYFFLPNILFSLRIKILFCKYRDLLRVDMVIFGLGFPLKALKRGRFSHPCKWWFVLLSNQYGTSQSIPLRAPASSLTLFPSSNWCRIAPKSTPFGAQRPYWHTALWLPPLGNSEKAGTSSGTPPCVYPLSGNSEKASTSLVSGSDTICNDSNPPLADIILFGLSLSCFPSRL